MALALFAAACCAAWKGDPLVAARLHGAADKEFDVAIADGVYLWTGFEQQVHDREQAKVRGALGDAEFEEAHQAGGTLAVEQSLDEALGRSRR